MTKAYEYMAAGLPVIYTRRAFTERFFEQTYQCGVCVDAKNTDEIAEAIHRLIQNPGSAQEMGANGRNAIMDEMNWEAVAKQIADLYESL